MSRPRSSLLGTCNLRKHRNTFNLHICSQGKLFGCHACPAWFVFAPVGGVDLFFFLVIREREKKKGQGSWPKIFVSFPYLVHSSEICHVVDKDVYFDDIVDIGSSSFEDCCEIFDGLMLFFFRHRSV